MMGKTRLQTQLNSMEADIKDLQIKHWETRDMLLKLASAMDYYFERVPSSQAYFIVVKNPEKQPEKE